MRLLSFGIAILAVLTTPAASVPSLNHRNGDITAKVSSLGATLTHLLWKDAKGIKRDLVSGYDDPSETLIQLAAGNNSYFGVAVGRVANRIGNATFDLNSQTYNLSANNGPNMLHGGKIGFDQKFWNSTIVSRSPPTVKFTYLSPHLEENFPGELLAILTFTLHPTAITLSYTAALTTKNPKTLKTIVNLTQHPFWNLAALEMDSGLVPTGAIIPFSARRDLDFTTAPKTVGRDLAIVRNQTEGDWGGYDHHFLVRKPSDFMKPPKSSTPDLALPIHVIAKSPDTNITMTVRSDAAGFQFYSGNWLSGHWAKETQKFPLGKDGKPVVNATRAVYDHFSCFAFEPSAPVDAVHHKEWADTVVIGRGQTWKQRIVFEFGNGGGQKGI
ncbi:hypothetical protein HDV00_012734 [Rhizophlyctis rosea]|nr:hypothetical protein HDV00_012734 [Rhizophlyctis rosea]